MFLKWGLPLFLAFGGCRAGYETINSTFDRSNSVRVKHFAEGELCDGGSAHHTGWVDIKDKHIFFCVLLLRQVTPTSSNTLIVTFHAVETLTRLCKDQLVYAYVASPTREARGVV